MNAIRRSPRRRPLRTPPLPRRLVAGATAVLALLTGGCTSSDRTGAEYANEAGKRITSHDGAFTAELKPGPIESGPGASLHPVISDRSGTVTFSDPEDYSVRHGVAILWQTDANVLWVLSGDVGNSRIAESGGVWSKTLDANPPPEVKALVE